MNLKTVIAADTIDLHLKGSTKKEIINELLDKPQKRRYNWLMRRQIMKKIAVSLLIILMTGVSLIGCAPDDPPPGKKIDSRLVGGYWWELERYRQDNYYFHGYKEVNMTIYKFTTTEIIEGYYNQNGGVGAKFVATDTKKAYTENNAIYSLDDNTLLFNYIFGVKPTDFDSDYQAIRNSGQQAYYPRFTVLQDDINAGKTISLKRGNGSPVLFINSSAQHLRYVTW